MEERENDKIKKEKKVRGDKREAEDKKDKVI